MKPSIHSTYLNHHQDGRCYERLIKICVPPVSWRFKYMKIGNWFQTPIMGYNIKYSSIYFFKKLLKPKYRKSYKKINLKIFLKIP